MLVNDICCVVANRFASWSVASETKDVQLSDQVERLRASAMNSQVLAAKLRSEMRAAAERLNDRVD
jgi:methyl-accepting chemotaxis protein